MLGNFAAQCEPLHITWDRHSATGPSGVAPYTLQVFTSAYVFPFIIDAGDGPSFDWLVPFAPGTQFQICMFDKNGNTGGCQMIYTVTNSSATCSNATFPLGPLDVEAHDSSGPLSQFAFVNSCSDISVKPVNGTPPYTLTVCSATHGSFSVVFMACQIAPSLHPPRNITIDSSKAVNWTVDLSWASPFFISVADSASPMNFWSYGPLHSGDGDTACLDVKNSQQSSKSPAPTIGAGVGGLVVGLLAGILATWFFNRRRTRRRGHMNFTVHNSDSPVPLATEFGGGHPGGGGVHYSSVPSGHMGEDSLGSTHHQAHGPHYHIEPFVLPSERPNVLDPPSSPQHTHPVLHRAPSSFAESIDARSPSATTAYHDPFGAGAGAGGRPTSVATHAGPQPQSVYVVHHDGGKAPVTVYVQDGAEVVELPPRYNEGTPGSPGRGEGSHVGSTSGSDARSGGGRSASDLRSEGEDGMNVPGFLSQQRRPNQPRKPQWQTMNQTQDPLS
ncbi:hypothetical protein HGRIS_007466 [Hohenbuehelia grisea]|uniref:Transmembrane protein n=1 Tax=Hohenbuehelia grisea TaxID=104357 RepID=A0ABR3J4X8_9AGAR